MGFPGEGCFRHLGGMGGQHACIGRNTVAGLEQHKIAGHELLRGHDGGLRVATHPCNGCQHVLQGGQCRLGAMLLEEAECRIEQHHDGDDDGVLEVADHAGQHGGADQHDDEEISELVEELAPRCSRQLLGEAVGAAIGQPLRGLRIGEPMRRVYAKLIGNLLDGQRVPGRVGHGPERSLEAAHRWRPSVGIGRASSVPHGDGKGRSAQFEFPTIKQYLRKAQASTRASHARPSVTRKPLIPRAEQGALRGFDSHHPLHPSFRLTLT